MLVCCTPKQVNQMNLATRVKIIWKKAHNVEDVNEVVLSLVIGFP